MNYITKRIKASNIEIGDMIKVNGVFEKVTNYLSNMGDPFVMFNTTGSYGYASFDSDAKVIVKTEDKPEPTAKEKRDAYTARLRQEYA